MDNKQNYLIHPFCTSTNYYLYDANTDAVISVSKKIYDFFLNVENKWQLSIKESSFLNKLHGKGFLLPCNIEKIEHPATHFLSTILDRKIKNITLQVTQSCNLRCSYCVYSGKYNTRKHSPKSMSLDLAKKGIDFLFEHSMDTNSVDIGFYGGEPLLKFDMIKKLVHYAYEQGEGKEITFNMTTNGTIITDEIINFLLDHKFNILISLDGPKPVHDKNRVFAMDGKGTFDTIISNIIYIRKNYPELYSRIAFSTVIDPETDNSCSNTFFLQFKEIEGIPVMAGMISDEYKSEKMTIPDSFFIQDEKDTFQMLLYKLGRLTEKSVSQITRDKFNQLNTSMFFQRQRVRGLPKKIHHSGPCIPGAKKLFMNIHGTFYPCEKVSEGSLNTMIGNIESGFDIVRATSILNVGAITENECKSCWNILLCSQCIISADDTNGVSKAKKIKSCVKSKRISDKLLKDYCTLIEYGYKFENSAIPVIDFEETQS